MLKKVKIERKIQKMLQKVKIIVLISILIVGTLNQSQLPQNELISTGSENLLRSLQTSSTQIQPMPSTPVVSGQTNEKSALVSENPKTVSEPNQSTDYPTNLNKNGQREEVNKDENENWYIQRGDGSRIYLTGAWQGMNVWQDEKGNFYTNAKHGARSYLTGPVKGLNSFKDIEGNWFAISKQFKKVYYTGPNAI